MHAHTHTHTHRAIELEMMRGLQYDEEKNVCKALIDYVYKLSLNSSVPSSVTESPPSTSVNSPPLTESSAAAIVGEWLTVVCMCVCVCVCFFVCVRVHIINHSTIVLHHSLYSADNPGEFLKRKETSEVLVPATTRKRSRRDKKRHAVSGKVRLNLNNDLLNFVASTFLVVPLTC